MVSNMKIKCDFCDATSYGTRDELQETGWMRAVFYAPVRKTITACKDDVAKFHKTVSEIFERGRKE